MHHVHGSGTLNINDYKGDNYNKIYIELTDKDVSDMSDSEKAEIFYTLDGTLPTVESNRYVAPFEVNENITIKAIARQIGFFASDPAIINSSSNIKMS